VTRLKDCPPSVAISGPPMMARPADGVGVRIGLDHPQVKAPRRVPRADSIAERGRWRPQRFAPVPVRPERGSPHVDQCTLNPGSANPIASEISGQASSLPSTRTRGRRRQCAHHGMANTSPPPTRSEGSGDRPGLKAVAAAIQSPAPFSRSRPPRLS
jgi:hypothetical protein